MLFLGATEASQALGSSRIIAVHMPVNYGSEQPLSASWVSSFNSRCAQLKAIGVDAIRITISWASEEPSEGVWSQDAIAYHQQTIQIIKDNGMNVILLLRFNDVPSWVRNYADTYFVNERGEEFTYKDVSFWNPNIRGWYDKFLQHVASTYTDTAIVAVQPSIDAGGGEAVYPVANPKSFWMYDPNSLAGFKAKYGTDLPKPGTATGPTWKNAIDWYLDSKNDFVGFVMQKAKQYFSGKDVSLLITSIGVGITDSDISNAINSGSGNDEVKIGANLTWLMDYAVTNGIIVDYTYFESAGGDVVANYMLGRGVSFFFVEETGKSTTPEMLADKILNYQGNISMLWYDDGRLFANDGVTPTSQLASLKTAISSLKLGVTLTPTPTITPTYTFDNMRIIGIFAIFFLLILVLRKKKAKR